MADGKNKAEKDKSAPKQMSTRKTRSKTKKEAADVNMEVGTFENLALDQRQQQILHNAAEELITQKFLPNMHQPNMQQNQHQQQQNPSFLPSYGQSQHRFAQPNAPQQPPQHQFAQPAIPQLRHRVPATVSNPLQQQQQRVATVAPHLHGFQTYHQSQPHQTRQHIAAAVSSSSQSQHDSDRMRGENPGAWLGGGIGGMLRQGILASSGEDVELGANVEVASSTTNEDMDVDENSGDGEFMSLETPDFLQQLSNPAFAAAASQGDGSSMEQVSLGEEFWNTINADNSLLTSFLSSHSSGEQPISLGTVLDVLGINTDAVVEEQPISPSHSDPNLSPQQQGTGSGAEAMVLNDTVVMWAPPDHAQSYIKQQESLLGQHGESSVMATESQSSPAPIKSPPPPLPCLSANIPVPQAKSALEHQQQTFSGISTSDSASCITRAATSTTDVMSTSDDSASQGKISSPKLPEYCEMIVRGYYRQQELFKIPVANEEGCVLFYKQPKRTPEEDLSRMTLVQFPEVNEHSGMSEKSAQYTRKVTDVIEKGVLIRERDGYIYATRRCRSKVFVCSSQDVKGESKELERDKETMVFNPFLFEKRFRKWLLKGMSGGKSRPRPPNIVFTFAQRWNWTSHHPLMNCLVYAVVTPMRARTQLTWGPGSTEKEDSLNRDYNSGMLQISTPSQPGSGPGSSGMSTGMLS